MTKQLELRTEQYFTTGENEVGIFRGDFADGPNAPVITFFPTDMTPEEPGLQDEIKETVDALVELKASKFDKLVVECQDEHGRIEDGKGNYHEKHFFVSSKNYDYWLRMIPWDFSYNFYIRVSKRKAEMFYLTFDGSEEQPFADGYMVVEGYDKEDAIWNYQCYHFLMDESKSNFIAVYTLEQWQALESTGECHGVLRREVRGISREDAESLSEEGQHLLGCCGVCEEMYHRNDLNWVNDHKGVPYKWCCPNCMDKAQEDMDDYYERVKQGLASEDY